MRIRTIKPEFWLHEGLCRCSEFTRLLAIALLNWADDEGYFLAHPNLIKGSLFPFVDDSKNVPGSLQELSRVGWIELGQDDQQRSVGRILNFSKHQRVDKPQASKIKASSTFQDQSKIVPRIILDDSTRERNGKEENGTGKDTPNPQGGKHAKSKAASPEEAEFFACSIGCTPGQGEAFFWKMEGNGWSNGGRPVKDWQATVRAWKAAGYLPVPEVKAATRPHAANHEPADMSIENTMRAMGATEEDIQHRLEFVARNLQQKSA